MAEQAVRRAAVFLMALGPEAGGKVMSKLPEPLIEELAHMIAGMGHVTNGDKNSALAEFLKVSRRISGLARGGEATARTILESGFGSRTADTFIERITSYGTIKGFEPLEELDPLTVANYLKTEHPQTIAAVLAHVDPRISAPILVNLPTDLQGDVAHRVAVLDAPSHEMLGVVEEVLSGRLQGEITASRARCGGRKQMAEILKKVERDTGQEILDEMREIDDDVANEVNGLMFVFEDIVLLDDSDIQEVLKEIDMRGLTLALKGATEEIKERIFANISKRAAEGVIEDMDYMGPVRLTKVEEAQKQIVDVVRSMEKVGTVSLGRGGKSTEIVS